VIGAPRFVVEGADDPFAFCANHLGSPSMKNCCFGFGRLMLRQIRRRSICTMHSRANNLQQSWRFDWEPPKAVLRDVWTIDWILDC
jgi:hypothetical protein